MHIFLLCSLLILACAPQAHSAAAPATPSSSLPLLHNSTPSLPAEGSGRFNPESPIIRELFNEGRAFIKAEIAQFGHSMQSVYDVPLSELPLFKAFLKTAIETLEHYAAACAESGVKAQLAKHVRAIKAILDKQNGCTRVRCYEEPKNLCCEMLQPSCFYSGPDGVLPGLSMLKGAPEHSFSLKAAAKYTVEQLAVLALYGMVLKAILREPSLGGMMCLYLVGIILLGSGVILMLFDIILTDNPYHATLIMGGPLVFAGLIFIYYCIKEARHAQAIVHAQYLTIMHHAYKALPVDLRPVLTGLVERMSAEESRRTWCGDRPLIEDLRRVITEASEVVV